MGLKTAYFSMEIALEKEMKTYSGGLGVLAGDTLKSAADTGYPVAGVTLLYREGFLQQKIEGKEQIEKEDAWNTDKLEKLDVQTSIELFGREVDITAYKYVIEGVDGEVPVIFLDTDLETNQDYDRSLTSRLYLGDRQYRLAQEAVLGIGGVRILDELGYQPEKYHMNEGHSCLLTTELLDRFENIEDRCVFTTHTPVEAGHDVFKRSTVENVLTSKADQLRDIGFGNDLNTTELAMKYSGFVNAVSEKHGDVSEEMFPNQEFEAITNGVHSTTWTSSYFKDLFDSEISEWRREPSMLPRVLKIEDKKLWDAKKKAKKDLIDLVEEKTGKKLDQEKFTLGYARRSTSYKRPTLLFKDLERLDRIGDIQIVYAGKAHPDDTEGKRLIKKIIGFSEILENVEVVFLEDYDMGIAEKMVSGVDLWLNTPRRGKEASGTSGMKAAHNGVPQLSVLDGWWLEGHIEGVTGWSIGEEYVEGEDQDEIDSKSLYEKLDQAQSIYHDDRKRWIEIMKSCIAINASYFNTDRMVKDYIAKAYR